ncbi:MAG: glycosyltransferase family 4 protein [Candidatus Riflebacteria bacterium]|mgnify:CR=1 FL=1|nr:glycosyltransferase family 4 protein [Candidatus Riflebacteria bacterium]
MTSRKILMATGIYPPDIGGPATMIEAMTVALCDHGYSCSVLAYGDADAKLRAGRPDRQFNVTRINKNRRSPLRQAIFLAQLLRMAKGADLLYATDTYSVGLSCLLAKKLLKVPYILRFAGDSAWELASSTGEVTDDLETFQKRKYGAAIEARKRLRKSIMCNADHVIAVSGFMQQITGTIGVKSTKCSLIYNSVDFLNEPLASTAIAPLIAELRHRLPPDVKLVGTACRLTAWKGVDILIKAAAILKTSPAKVQVVVMGDGPEKDNLSKLANDCGMQNEVHFLGCIPQADMASYLHSLDIFALCSLYEGLSHTILQAMQAGTPVIASNIGGNPELITHEKTGLLVPVQDPNSLAEAVAKLVKGPELRRQLASNAHNELGRYSWNTAVNSTCRIIETVLSSR